MLHCLWIPHHFQRLAQQLRIVENFAKLWVRIHELLHLRVHFHHGPHEIRIVKERLHQRRIHHLGHLLRIHILWVHHPWHHSRRHICGCKRVQVRIRTSRNVYGPVDSWSLLCRWRRRRNSCCGGRWYRSTTLDKMKRGFVNNGIITQRAIVIQNPSLINQSLQRDWTMFVLLQQCFDLSNSRIRQGRVQFQGELGSVGKANEHANGHALLRCDE